MSRTLSSLQAILLGVVVLLGIVLVGVAVYAVGSRQWFGSNALHVRAGFPNIQGVEVGTRVRIRGLDAGEVVALDCNPANAEAIHAIEGQVLGENTTMLDMCRQLGFDVVPDATDPAICNVKLAV